MRMKTMMLALAVLLSGLFTSNANAQDVFTGQKKLACEAVLCLASGTRPTECLPSLKKFFSIKFSNPLKTIKERGNFLKLCPTGDTSGIADDLAEIYGPCGTDGYSSEACSAFGTGDEVKGNCYELQAGGCNLFLPAASPDGVGTFGACVGIGTAFVTDVDAGISSCDTFNPIDTPVVPGDPLKELE